jgi:hypothetical protein
VHGAIAACWQAVIGTDDERDDGEDRQAKKTERFFGRRRHEAKTEPKGEED